MSEFWGTFQCTPNKIIYGSEFKKKAVKERLQGVAAEDIFNHVGLDFMNFSSAYTRCCINGWIFAHRDGGDQALERTSGNTKKINLKEMTQTERIMYLEAENAYLKELHSLIKARQKRENQKNSKPFME